MRITAGEFRNRRLLSPRGLATRPTAEKVRQALFNILGERTPGARFLDLFAGSGAVGLEALSRGARSAVFVENSREALNALRANIRALGAEEKASVLPLDWLSALKRLETRGELFDLIFADPPYRLAAATAPGNPLSRLFPCAILKPSGLLILESFARDPEREDVNLRLLRRADYGQTALSFYSLA